MVDNILLKGVVGSTAYGLAGPDSDVDRLGVFAAPTTSFHGLDLPIDKKATEVGHDPDVTMHEARKLAMLALGSNPTVTEIMWLPNDLYEIRSPLGDELIGIRSAFSCAKRVRDAYFGYAVSQLRRLVETGQFQSKMRARSSKHGRHLLRLLDQGFGYYATGELTIRVDDPQRARAALAEAEEKFDSVRSPLLDEPDERTVEDWLLRVRAAYYELAP